MIKLKSWIIGACLLVLTILTLGRYARSQKRRADKAERIAREADAIKAAIDKQKGREKEARKQNNEQRLSREKQKHERTFFDNLD